MFPKPPRKNKFHKPYLISKLKILSLFTFQTRCSDFAISPTDKPSDCNPNIEITEPEMILT